MVANGMLYTAGGYNGTTYYADTQFASINSDGTIASWASGTSFANASWGMSAVAYDGVLYVAGGVNGSTYYNSVYYAPVNNGGAGSTATWTTNGTNLTGAHASGWAYGKSFAANGFLYIVGGAESGTEFASVYYAPIASNGSVGSWTATSSMLSIRAGLGLGVYNGYVYAVGGSVGATRLNSVEYAVINANGTLGTWTSGGTFTNIRHFPGAVAYDGYLYVSGGRDGSTYYSDVQYASLDATTGAVGTFASTSSFTTARTYHQMVASSGYMYLMGGFDGTTPFGDVQYAVINSNGTLGTWAATQNMHVPRYLFEASVHNGFVYVWGGVNLATSLADASYAQIGTNGMLSNWQQAGVFTTKRNSLAGTIYNGTMYMLGGYSGSFFSDVQYAPLNVQSRVSHYSKLIDLGTTASYDISSISYNGVLPGGLRAITYKTADATGVLGSTAQAFDLAGLVPACTLPPNGRYVFLSVALDDSLNGMFPDSGGNIANISDITVNYNAPHAPPNMRLHNGKFFLNEVQQALDTCGP
jgi:hypothetical protein